VLENDRLGVGIANGAYWLRTDLTSPFGFSAGGNALMTFDDVPSGRLVHLNIVDDSSLLTPEQSSPMWKSQEDGAIKHPRAMVGGRTWPNTKKYYRFNEAGINAMQFWMDMSEQEIRDLRHEALERMFTHHKITQCEPSQFYDEPMENDLDLGGGNHVSPYVVSESMNHRVIIVDDGSVNGGITRVHEMGFGLFTGRAGIDSQIGWLPQGSVALDGFYVCETDEHDQMNLRYYDWLPNRPTSQSHYHVLQKVEHPDYGWGTKAGAMFSMDAGTQSVQNEIVWSWEWNQVRTN